MVSPGSLRILLAIVLLAVASGLASVPCPLGMMLDGHNRLPNMQVPVPDLAKAARVFERFKGSASDSRQARRWILFWSRGEALAAQLELNHLELETRLSRMGISDRRMQILYLQCLSDHHLLFALCPMLDILPRAEEERALAKLLSLRIDAENFFPSHPDEALVPPLQSAYEEAFKILGQSFAKNGELFRREFEAYVRRRHVRPTIGEALARFLRRQMPRPEPRG